MVTTRTQQLQITTRSKANSQTVFLELTKKSRERRRKPTRPQTRSQTQTIKEKEKEEEKEEEKDTKYETESTITYDSEDFDTYIDDKDDDDESMDDDETIGHTTTTSEVVFDQDYFDDAHDEWMKNKRKLGNGCYAYICGYVYANRKVCQRDCCDKIGLYSGCKKHYMWEEKIHKLLMIPEV